MSVGVDELVTVLFPSGPGEFDPHHRPARTGFQHREDGAGGLRECGACAAMEKANRLSVAFHRHRHDDAAWTCLEDFDAEAVGEGAEADGFHARQILLIARHGCSLGSPK